MEIENYHSEAEKIHNEFKQKIKELNVKFVSKNAKFKVGEIIKDSSSVIKIIKLKYSMLGSNFPIIIYEGCLLKKNLEPTLKEKFETVFESQAIKVNQ